VGLRDFFFFFFFFFVLDTLKELADALGNDPNFATTITNMIAGKQPLDETLTALSGKSVDGLIEYVGLR
ncbi:Long tail fiber protein p37 Protein Gp37, partial [Salmonella enterica subsp. enterica serovar Newport str. SHSN009]